MTSTSKKLPDFFQPGHKAVLKFYHGVKPAHIGLILVIVSGLSYKLVIASAAKKLPK